jgi:NADPH:quinone reductase-like Zn-dependent oxidoreductase
MTMKAAVIEAAGRKPVYGEFQEPSAAEGLEILTVHASALSQLAKGRASGSHYSADNVYPAVPGVDGVGTTADGRRVYFALPEAPFGSLAEKALVDPRHYVPVPNGLDDVTAAALANPGMSCWAALMERAHFQRGETVLINGATGTAGRIAVQLARYLGAAKIIATGRNVAELEEVKTLGADVVIPLSLDKPEGIKAYEDALIAEFANGVDVVVDYLWGQSAKSVITAVVKGVEDAHPVRFVQVGSIGGQDTLELPSSALRSSAIQLMGSGLKSVPLPKLLEAVKSIFEIAIPAGLQIATKTVPLADIATGWDAPTKPRVVFTIQ